MYVMLLQTTFMSRGRHEDFATAVLCVGAEKETLIHWYNTNAMKVAGCHARPILEGQETVSFYKDDFRLCTVLILDGHLVDDRHDWQVHGSPGLWETYYKCSKCERIVREDTDGLRKQETRCTGTKERPSDN